MSRKEIEFGLELFHLLWLMILYNFLYNSNKNHPSHWPWLCCRPADILARAPDACPGFYTLSYDLKVLLFSQSKRSAFWLKQTHQPRLRPRVCHLTVSAFDNLLNEVRHCPTCATQASPNASVSRSHPSSFRDPRLLYGAS